MNTLNETHDPCLRSWVSSAQDERSDFPIQNLPYAVFRPRTSGQAWRGGVAIGDEVLDLAALAHAQLIQASDPLAPAALNAAAQETLNEFMALGPAHWGALRRALSRLLRWGAAEKDALQQCLVPQAQVEYRVPARVGDYTDFYTSVHHATNVGRLFRPDSPLPPNYKWMPIGYHGRVSSLLISETEVRRPRGQLMPPGAPGPTLAACKRLDYELELGVFIGPGNELGQAINLDEAEAHVFGLCLLNDWSARDIQVWEYQPLGPFLSKNFATSLSPWVVTMEALAPYRLPFTRPSQDPQPLPYLDSPTHRTQGSIDIQLEVRLQTLAMRQAGQPAAPMSQSNYRHAYWTLAQMVTHHAASGCNLQPGDLLGTGTQSGPEPGEGGALIELTLGGQQPLSLPCGERRTFLEDGDTVALRAWCERPGAARLGFGVCEGQVLPASP
ncbi:MAG: fumarylacetoacetase [Betaproteobacteria bacterium]|nr:fumarylacetoacetase [Betaproteobacteria bacterium]